jgi:lipopolysaccharide/colanic/teichoic acid biosynthesis glycosyltransferase
MGWWLPVRLVLDRLAAAALLVLVAPVILVLMVMVRLHDGGPALIAVPRIGRYGARIRMWKLRSMRAEAPGGFAHGISLTSADDDRITPVGRRMRAWYLDELPQLWNVVRGDMCLLGARPEAPEYVDLDDPRWVAVLAVPPGMAGATQLIVNHWEREVISASPGGAGYVNDVLPVKLAIDEWYLDRSSPRVDAMVLGALLRRFIPGATNRTLKTRVTAEVPEVQAVVDHIDRSHPVAVAG